MPLTEPSFDDEPTPEKAVVVIDAEWEIVKDALAISAGTKELVPNFDATQVALFAASGEYTVPPTTEDEQTLIIHQQRELAKFRNAISKKIDKLKEPLNEVRTKLIALEKTLCGAVNKEELRLQGLVQHRQKLLLRAQQDRDAEIAREQKRLADEAAAATRLQEEAEKARQSAEQAKTEEEAKKLLAEAAAKDEEAFERSLAAETTELPLAAPQEAPKAREVFDFEIIGSNDIERKASLIKLAQAAPWLFTPHVNDTKPRSYSLNLSVRTLTDSLNGNPPLKEPLPGIKITTKLTTLR